MLELRPYQKSGIDKLRDGLRLGNKRQILYLPTGGGKSRLAAAIISNITERSRRVAFICNRIELVSQASGELSKHGIRHGIIQGQNSINTGRDVVVCSIQTLARRGYPEVEFLIVDEAHACAGSEAYKNLFKAYNNLPVIGLTATPFSKGLGKTYPEMYGPMFNSIVVAATIPELIEDGYLVDCDIYAPSEPDLSGVKIVAGDYNEEQLGEAVDKPKLVGDIVSHYQRLTPGKRAICFATNINHSKHIVATFVSNGIDARHIDAYTPDDERIELIKSFKEGKFPILSNCSLLAEGFDCPETEVIILARPTRSLIRYIQMSGRALRPHHGKEKAIILDHSGTVKILGFPTDELPLELDDGKPKASKPKENLPKVCPSCAFVYKKGTKKCPCCGFEPVAKPGEVEVEEGELKKLERKKVFTHAEKQDIYSALYAVQTKKGYKPGWVSNNYRDIVGVWPKGQIDKPGDMIPLVENHLLYKAIKWANSPENKSVFRGSRNPHECPTCHKVGNYYKTEAKGPHGPGAKCVCGTHWWLPKGEA